MPSTTDLPIIPLGEYILVVPSTSEELTKNGVYNAGNGTKDRTEAMAIKGTVLALPEGYKGKLKLDSNIFVAKWEVQKAKLSTKDYIFVKEKDVLGIITNI